MQNSSQKVALVNASDPGYTATNLNGNRGHQTVPEGAAETIRLALLPDDGPSGTCSTATASSPGNSNGTMVAFEGAA
jgi:hypothetical protein